MKGKMKKMLLALGLCLIVGLQSAGAVQAAVNYEACPFCGTMVTRGTVLEKVGEESHTCGQHPNCMIKVTTFKEYETVNCQTNDCPVNHSFYRGKQEIVQHFVNQ